jgi:cobalt-zinc-cadmium resistance protein CzcA
MLQSIINFSIRNKLIIGVLISMLIGVGVYSIVQLPVDAIPDITNNQVQVLTVCPTLATQEVEQFVTTPIEFSVRSIPGVTELRSISRFGLSVVTIVFEEGMDPFLARQLISEKLKMAEASIPKGFGTPEMAPISTGLGEILHYRIEPLPGFEDRYSPADLRTIQDWIVKRQLSGIPGVVEVNSFGGFLKQYEVALSPQRLRNLGLGIQDVFSALEDANENTGGAYIEHHSSMYFIRTEGLVRSLDDIRNIAVRSGSSAPIKIGDVGEVRFGHAVRYGAVSHNGEGEIVLGIVMMLKGEHAARVIEKVKVRMESIRKSLPEGVTLTTFLDREDLVKRTIRTVEKNLIEGALIVIFVLVLLLGNLRAGLIIASVIPLSMLFAISMMKLFGVSANLMSLGAIDFGLIVDGAVIIVEATLHYLATQTVQSQGINGNGITYSKLEMNTKVSIAAGKVMRSSIFGTIIILVVYLPVLSLSGIEGKMFKPMAQTVSFALIGALLLSLTYVPAMSAFFLSRKIRHEITFADRLMQFLKGLYRPSLEMALKWPRAVISFSMVVFAVSIFLFSRLGGEFIPTLDEGDIMMHGFLRPGASLSQTLESHRLVQDIILKHFPDEVDQVISKIGSAEIPTDPMAIETADNILLLKDKAEWKRATTKAELVALIEEKVHEVPGMAFEFTQPIKMRFDEMMTGVRSDIAVKIFGENLDSLSRAGQRAASLLSQIPGVVDVKTEQIEGLPQISVRYNHAQIARYGLHIKDLNETIRTAFAGSVAGVVFENERRFDLVVRLDTSFRTGIADVRNLPVVSAGGALIPLQQVAEVSFQPGAAQISRDDGRRRIVVSANVRGLDIESAIEEVRQVIDKKLKLPAGYSVVYGGQFENLQAAKARLSVAVPVALLLIFVLLYFAFNSLKESLLIFSAIPMAAIGGVFALLLRDMPFSISAGVGFIALFGIAVLNGIVMIAYFNQLEQEGVEDTHSRIIHGALTRLRPVLMTASVASLGFLPMALSQGAGAEVQRPLATVVIGGLLTSTLLTLILLPVLYGIFFRHKTGGSGTVIHTKALALMVIILGGAGTVLQAQISLTEQAAIEMALSNHPAVQSADLKLREKTALLGAARIWEPGEIFHNIAADPDYGMFGTTALGLSQTFPVRKMTEARKVFFENQTKTAEAGLNMTRRQLARSIQELYQHLSFIQREADLYRRMDSIFGEVAEIADLRYANGEISLAEQLALRAKAAQVRMALETSGHEIEFDRVVLGQLVGISGPIIPVMEPFRRMVFSLVDTALIENAAQSLYDKSLTEIAGSELALVKANRAVGFSAGAMVQYLPNGLVLPGWQVGIRLPLASGHLRASEEAALHGANAAQRQYQASLLQRRNELAHLLHDQEKYSIQLDYYESGGKAHAAELLRSASANYIAGEIGFVSFAQIAEQAMAIELKYLESLLGLNMTVIELRALTGQ